MCFSWLKCYEFFRQLFMTKQGLILENLMLRQQLNIYKRKNKRPKLKNIDRIILVWISKVFSKWKSVLVVAKASTLIGWHRKGFKIPTGLLFKPASQKKQVVLAHRQR